MAEDTAAKVLGIPGSLRRGSYNRGLLEAARELAPAGMSIDIVDLDAIPPYNADVEAAGEPEPVRLFKSRIGGADGLLIATPEYNHGMPGVLKNAIDWASRPGGNSVLKHKPVAVMGASPGASGTARAQLWVRQSFASTESYVMLAPQLIVPNAAAHFDTAGRLTDESIRRHIAALLAAFQSWMGRFAGAPTAKTARPAAT